MAGKPAKPMVERFWANVDRRGDDECWGWKGERYIHHYKKIPTYGRFFIKTGQVTGAHRVSWMIHFGDIPPGMHVLHKCDNPECTNPKHLWLGTHQQNMTDKSVKGRGCGNGLFGQDHGRAVLTEDQVVGIIADLKAGVTMSTLARKHGVCYGTIQNIKRGTGWKHLPR